MVCTAACCRVHISTLQQGLLAPVSNAQHAECPIPQGSQGTTTGLNYSTSMPQLSLYKEIQVQQYPQANQSSHITVQGISTLSITTVRQQWSSKSWLQQLWAMQFARRSCAVCITPQKNLKSCNIRRHDRASLDRTYTSCMHTGALTSILLIEAWHQQLLQMLS